MRGVVVFVLLSTVLVARADERADARAHYDRANAAYALARYSEAALEYEKAFDLRPDSALLYNAAQAHRIAGNKQRALVLYQNYLRVFGDQVSNVDEVRRHIAELKQAIESEERSKTSPPTEPIHPGAPGPAPQVGVAPEKRESAPDHEQPEAAPTVAPSLVVSAPAPAPEKKPLVKRGWFWGVMVGAVVVVGAGVALGVVYGSSVKNPSPSIGVAQGN